MLTFSSSACLRIPRLSSLVICTWASHTGQVSREVDGKFTEENRLLMTSYAYVFFPVTFLYVVEKYLYRSPSQIYGVEWMYW